METEAEAADPGVPTPGADARPWIVIGLILLCLFLVVLLAAVVFGLGR